MGVSLDKGLRPPLHCLDIVLIYGSRLLVGEK